MTGPGEILADGLRSLALPLGSTLQAKLLEYLHLLEKWNRVYNLTGVCDLGEMVRRHLLDSLTVVPYLEGRRVIDVGSGAGVPGIPLAVACKQRSFVLLDASAKRTRFLVQAVAELKLDNVEVVCSRVEDHTPPEPYDAVVARAFAPLPELLRLTKHLCRDGGLLLAMKGTLRPQEYVDLPPGFELEAVFRLDVPGLDAERHLVRVRRVD